MPPHLPWRQWTCPRCVRSIDASRASNNPLLARRFIQINPAPAASSPQLDSELPTSSVSPPTPSPDARFEVLGAPFSLLSVALSASQNLYTRRGTLVAMNGKADNAISTLSLLEPFRRAAFGIPFLYQRISSTSPITALISAKSPATTFSVIHLDGRLDWIVTQRDALLAWTGSALSVRPRINIKLSLAHWGSTLVTGRGLLALVGKGNVYQITLRAGEEYVVHPSNVVAYAMNLSPPQPYRFKSTSLRLQIPGIEPSRWLPDIKFIRVMRDTNTYKTLANIAYYIRTWARRTIWGDRLFLKFHGPSTILLQSRGSRISDILSTSDVNEIADTPVGAVQDAVKLGVRTEEGHGSSTTETKAAEERPVKMTYATIGGDKKVTFGDS